MSSRTILKRFIRTMWQAQPRKLRRLELDLIEKFLTRSLPKDREIRSGDIVVCGFLGSATGLGQGARQMLALFKEQNLPAFGGNASNLALLDDFKAGPTWPSEASDGGVLIIHVNPDILSIVWNALPRAKLMHRYIVGVWAWELETPPERWKRSAQLVDEIWAPTRFIADALRKISCGKPVHVVPHPFATSKAPPPVYFDPFPELLGKTIVFFAYDVRSIHARKNPEAVVTAFQKAAGNRPDAELIIKISNGSTWPNSLKKLQALATDTDNITFIEKTFTDAEMQSLMKRVDIVVSLHRSEGFGLLIANAMAAGKAVIATGWSGNLDFMTGDSSILVPYRLVPIIDEQNIYNQVDCEWADPDTDFAAAALAELIANAEKRNALGEAAKRHSMEQFAAENWLKNLPEKFWRYVEMK